MKFADRAEMFGPFRVLVFSGNESYVAQGIDFDICVQADTWDGLRRAWWNNVAASIKIDIDGGNEPLRGGWVPKGFLERYLTAIRNQLAVPAPPIGPAGGDK